MTPAGVPSKGVFIQGGEVVVPGTTMHTFLTGLVMEDQCSVAPEE